MSVPTPYGGNRNAISAKSLSVSKPPALKAFMSQLDQQVQATDRYNKEKENVEKQHFAASKVMWKNGFGELSAIEQVHEIESIEAKQKAEKRKQEDLVKFFDAQLQIRNDNQAAIFAQYDADTQAQIKKINRDASLDREAQKEARKRIREEKHIASLVLFSLTMGLYIK